MSPGTPHPHSPPPPQGDGQGRGWETLSPPPLEVGGWLRGCKAGEIKGCQEGIPRRQPPGPRGHIPPHTPSSPTERGQPGSRTRGAQGLILGCGDGADDPSSWLCSPVGSGCWGGWQGLWVLVVWVLVMCTLEVSQGAGVEGADTSGVGASAGVLMPMMWVQRLGGDGHVGGVGAADVGVFMVWVPVSWVPMLWVQVLGADADDVDTDPGGAGTAGDVGTEDAGADTRDHDAPSPNSLHVLRPDSHPCCQLPAPMWVLRVPSSTTRPSTSHRSQLLPHVSGCLRAVPAGCPGRMDAPEAGAGQDPAPQPSHPSTSLGTTAAISQECYSQQPRPISRHPSPTAAPE